MLLIRGLPSTVALTEGRLFQSGVWSVKLSDLPNLRIVAPSSIETSNINFVAGHLGRLDSRREKRDPQYRHALPMTRDIAHHRARRRRPLPRPRAPSRPRSP